MVQLVFFVVVVLFYHFLDENNSCVPENQNKELKDSKKGSIHVGLSRQNKLSCG